MYSTAIKTHYWLKRWGKYTAWGERLEQFTERGNWDRLLYVHEDVMGNTMHYTKATGQSFGELRYDVWGAPTLSGKLQNNDNGNFVAATFTGHIYDTVLDIYFAEARFYDAKHRQWMASDPIKDGLNWYEYCGSNPTTYFDPTGLMEYPVGYQEIERYLERQRENRKIEVRSKAYKNIDEFEAITQAIVISEEFVLHSEMNIVYDSIDKMRTIVESYESKYFFATDVSSIIKKNGKSLLSNLEKAVYSYFPNLACIVAIAKTEAEFVAGTFFNNARHFFDSKGELAERGRLDGTNMNAFLHSYWNAYIYQGLLGIGYSKADAEIATWSVTTAHELGATIKDPWNMSNIIMDLHNNKLGITAAAELMETNKYGIFSGNKKQEDLVLKLLASIEAGEGYRISAINHSPNDGFDTPKSMHLSEGALLVFATNADERSFNSEDEVKRMLRYLYY